MADGEVDRLPRHSFDDRRAESSSSNESGVESTTLGNNGLQTPGSSKLISIVHITSPISIVSTKFIPIIHSVLLKPKYVAVKLLIPNITYTYDNIPARPSAPTPCEP